MHIYIILDKIFKCFEKYFFPDYKVSKEKSVNTHPTPKTEINIFDFERNIKQLESLDR